MKYIFGFFFLAVQWSGAMAQKLEIGIVDYYGLSAPGAPAKSQVEACLAFKTGDQLDPESKNIWKDPTIACLKKLPGIKQVKLEGVCCDEQNRVMIFVGVLPHPAPAEAHRSFTLDERLPVELVAAYDTLLGGMMIAIQTGQADEDDTKGHALFRFPKAIEPQRLFAAYASTHLATLREVLHHSRHDKDREVASWVIAFAEDKQGIVRDFVEAASDPSEDVRNNAIRALGILDNYFRQAKVDVSIDPTPFVEMMNSITWSDLNKSANLLVSLTSDRNPGLMAKLRKEALYPLADMARWKSTGHAYPAFMILGRMAGWPDEVTYQRANADRMKWIDAALLEIERKK
ncbi:MAG: HEAT repeat domain-containing protein [Cyclobacteriaceae bacterium]|nr:HEAT repeat domain-containing protein [Cyclobacteriaceae bacterium]